MSLLILCEIIFFFGFGVNHFYPNRNLTIVVAGVAILIGVILLLSGALGVRIN